RVIDFRPETKTLNDSALNIIGRNFKLPSQDMVLKLIQISNVSTRVQIQNGLSDLTSDDISLKGQLTTGSEIVFETQIKNIGEIKSTFTNIRLAIDDTIIDSLNISTIPSGGLIKIFFKPWRASAGEHIISIQVDSENSIIESNESNNVFSEKISITNQKQVVIIDKS
ncbi:MAG TPA: CARDB domain-containing protein, partial [Nitrososphaerales archaeon]